MVFVEIHRGDYAFTFPALSGRHPQWLAPIGADGSLSGEAGRTVPVQFTVTTPTGAFVADASVLVDILDQTGAVVVGPVSVAATPSEGVLTAHLKYHANLPTRALPRGVYVVRARFNSLQLQQPAVVRRENVRRPYKKPKRPPIGKTGY